MGRGKLSMGYVEVETREGCPLFPPGALVRGQVHHHSEIVQVGAPTQEESAVLQGCLQGAAGCSCAAC